MAKAPGLFQLRVKRLERENQILKEDLKAVKIDNDELERRMRALEIKVQRPSHC